MSAAKTPHTRKQINHSTRKNVVRKKRVNPFLKIAFAFVLVVFLGMVVGSSVFAYYAYHAPKLENSKLEAAASSRIFDAKGELIADLGAEQRTLIEPNDLPKLLSEAVVSVEDKRFYTNIGIDPIRILGSLVHNLTSDTTQGGSTLTQQLIKMSYFSTNVSDQTIARKAQEAWLALRLNQRDSKDQILCYYMNKVPMANGLYGMRTASQVYYGKEPDQLSIPEAALIAGLPQAPNAYNPYTNPEAAKVRRDIVLLTMKENNVIHQNEYEKALSVPITQGLQPLKETSQNWKIVDNYLKEVINEVTEKTGENPMKVGVDIYTNLDMNAQTKLYQIVNSDEYINFPDDDFQVASTIVNVENGQVVAQIGARKVPDNIALGNNQAVNTTRDWGSTMKPVTDYGPAIEFLNWPTNAMLNDAPYEYPGTTTVVNNWDNQYLGWLTMRKALMLSRNIPAIKTLEAVGLANSTQFLKGLGIDYPIEHYSNAISSNVNAQEIPKDSPVNQYGASSLKMAAAYAAFANGGTYYKPYYVNKIVFQDGTEKTYAPSGMRAMKETTAYMITDMLKDVISDYQATGTNAYIPGLYQAGKTGTSNYDDAQINQINNPSGQMIAPDENFIGYTQHYAMAVWTGYNNQLTPITSEYFTIASLVYKYMMEDLMQNVPNQDWIMPNELKRVNGELFLTNAQITEPSERYTPPVTSTENTTTKQSSSSVESSDTSETSTAPTSSSETPITENSDEQTEAENH